MQNLETEFEIAKVRAIALQHGLIFRRHSGEGLPTFDILDEYLDGVGYKIATVQWTGGSWACIPINCPESSGDTIEKVFRLTNSVYFWEMSTK